MPVLEFKNVCKSFGEGAHRTDVLKDINLEVEDGEFLVLLGFSGTGKTTLNNLMTGLEQPSKGSVTFKGEPITGPVFMPIRQRHCCGWAELRRSR